MSDQEVNDVLMKERDAENNQAVARNKKTQSKGVINSTGRDSISSGLEVTIYKRAVKTLEPNLSAQLDELLNKSRSKAPQPRKVSYSSDENMDLSDETVDNFMPNSINFNNLAGAAEVQSVQTNRQQGGEAYGNYC